MPKIGRDKLQQPTLQPAQIIAFYIGEKLHQHIKKSDHETPPLKWCSMAALFAIQGQYEATHGIFPNWLKSSFIKRHTLTIYSLEWCRGYAERFLHKRENETLTIALYCAMENYNRMKKGARIDSQDLLNTAIKHKWSVDHTDDTLTKAANKIHKLHKRFEAFRNTAEGKSLGEV